MLGPGWEQGDQIGGFVIVAQVTVAAMEEAGSRFI